MSTLYPDLDLTAFPNIQDSRYVMIDPSTTADMTAINSYNTYIAAGNMAAALQVLTDNPRLQKMLFNAEKWNRHEDMLIAMERFYESDVRQYLVNIVVYRGIWNTVDTYAKYNVVYSSTGECYMAIQDVPVNTEVTETNYWVPITLRGEKGDTGTGLSWRGEWKSNTAYSKDDCVAYDNKLYGALQASTGQPPATSTAYWTVAFEIDVSASSILAKIKTVDGAGSGLDADLLDGQHSSYYYSAAQAASDISTVNSTISTLETKVDNNNTNLTTEIGKKAAKTVAYTATATASGWSNKSQTIAVSGLSSTSNIVVGLSPSATEEQREACRDACISATSQTANGFVLACDGDIPAINIPLVVFLVG